MISEWREVLLEDVSSELTVGFVGSMAAEYVDTGVPFLRSLNIEPYRINLNDIKFISPDFHKKLSKSKLEPGDVVIVRTGKPGTCAVVPEWLKEANCSDLVIVRPGHELDAYYLAYYVNSIATHHVYSHLVGAVQQHFNVGSAKKMKILLPTLNEQRSITAVLNAISSKIELNNAINKNLEEMAQTLFKRWFVDFEFPNENGEPYKSSGGEFEESELGLIPKGWRVGAATEIFDVQSGGTPKTGNSEYWNGDIPFFTPKDCTDSFYVINTEKKITEVGLSKCNSKLYKAETVFITARGTVGKLSIAGQDMAMNQSCYALVATKGFTQKYIFLQTQLLINAIKKNASGAVFDAITVSTFQSLKVVLPNIELVVKFDKVVEGIFNSILKNINENQILSDSRDTLLPKLMSGEIRVPIDREYVQTADLPMAAASKEQYSTT
ncbi:restriction endonuclease subunit S [Brevibacillus choshinensis]|uniref:restriction endonuclease subunit S n=1 Tax=Brevibacillus choshinensis TaxID=54911 RepID=UPI002E1E31A3|nr:restriction endonuclease subunit S [Brevibacillus choshinensis]MED4754996.1 restriction endonuclease subunit S [Brevibacillus choshinensis]